MNEGEVRASIVFVAQDPEVSGDPAEALTDVLDLLVRLRPEWLDFAVRFESASVTVGLAVDFGPEGAGKVELLSVALAKGEGRAGYRAGFHDDAEEPSDWVLSIPRMEDASLPTGEPFAVPLALGAGVGVVLRRLRLTDAAFGYRLTAMRAGPAGNETTPAA